jgi:hypothetical protein
MSDLSKNEQRLYFWARSPWGNPLRNVERIHQLADELGITRAEATRVYLLAHGR